MTLAAALLWTVVPAFAHAVAMPAPTHAAAHRSRARAKLVVASQFADPGFAKFGSSYFLYATGTGFAVSSSTAPDHGYGRPRPSMGHIPGWVGRAPSGARHFWAPSVFAVTGTRQPLYVMYFTGYASRSHGHRWGANCVGVATSHSPSYGFVARARPICAKTPAFEAIDPTMYRAPGGARYLVYKRHNIRRDTFAIRVIQMRPRFGIRPLRGGLRRTLVSSGAQMEAPSLINRRGRVWLFLSRRNWRGCSYATDAWSARSISRGRFTRAGWVLTSASTGLCGPGGASVVQDGPITRIAFHAWKGPHAQVRQTWVGTVRWSSDGKPHFGAASR